MILQILLFLLTVFFGCLSFYSEEKSDGAFFYGIASFVCLGIMLLTWGG